MILDTCHEKEGFQAETSVQASAGLCDGQTQSWLCASPHLHGCGSFVFVGAGLASFDMGGRKTEFDLSLLLLIWAPSVTGPWRNLCGAGLGKRPDPQGWGIQGIRVYLALGIWPKATYSDWDVPGCCILCWGLKSDRAGLNPRSIFP